MSTIDLEKLIESAGVSRAEIAELIFPQNKHKDKAIKRVISGESELTASQVVKLSTYFGLNVSDMFEGIWQHARATNGMLTLVKGDFKAQLDPKTMTSKLYKKGIYKDTIIHSSSVTLSKYVEELNKLTK